MTPKNSELSHWLMHLGDFHKPRWGNGLEAPQVPPLFHLSDLSQSWKSRSRSWKPHDPHFGEQPHLMGQSLENRGQLGSIPSFQVGTGHKRHTSAWNHCCISTHRAKTWALQDHSRFNFWGPWTHSPRSSMTGTKDSRQSVGRSSELAVIVPKHSYPATIFTPQQVGLPSDPGMCSIIFHPEAPSQIPQVYQGTSHSLHRSGQRCAACTALQQPEILPGGGTTGSWQWSKVVSLVDFWQDLSKKRWDESLRQW